MSWDRNRALSGAGNVSPADVRWATAVVCDTRHRGRWPDRIGPKDGQVSDGRCCRMRQSDHGDQI